MILALHRQPIFPKRDPETTVAADSVGGPMSVMQTPRYAAKALFDDHFDRVWRFLRCLGVAERDLEETVSEVFTVAYERLRECPEKGATTWLRGICCRVASERLRRVRTSGF